MGNWHISIRGVGSHHNQNNPTDADKMFRQMVADLRAAGHHIDDAAFTHGAVETANCDCVASDSAETER
jgi:hypothetical protein